MHCVDDWPFRKLALLSNCIFSALEFDSGVIEVIDEFIWDGDLLLMQRVISPLCSVIPEPGFHLETEFTAGQREDARLIFLVAMSFGWYAAVHSLDRQHRVAVDHEGFVSWSTMSPDLDELLRSGLVQLAPTWQHRM